MPRRRLGLYEDTCRIERGASGVPAAGGASKRLEVFAVVTQILNALAAVATVAGFLLEACEKILRLRKKRKNAHVREARKEAGKEASENK